MEKPGRLLWLITETGYMSGDLWNLLIIVKTTATIAVSGEATRRLPATGCHRSRLWSAAASAMDWDFGPLCFRAARTHGLRMRRLPIWWNALKSSTRTVRSHCLWVKKGTIPISAGLMRGQSHWLSDRLRNHGRLAVSDHRPYCGGPGIYAQPSAGDGGNRSVYPPSRYPL